MLPISQIMPASHWASNRPRSWTTREPTEFPDNSADLNRDQLQLTDRTAHMTFLDQTRTVWTGAKHERRTDRQKRDLPETSYAV